MEVIVLIIVIIGFVRVGVHCRRLGRKIDELAAQIAADRKIDRFLDAS